MGASTTGADAEGVAADGALVIAAETLAEAAGGCVATTGDDETAAPSVFRDEPLSQKKSPPPTKTTNPALAKTTVSIRLSRFGLSNGTPDDNEMVAVDMDVDVDVPVTLPAASS